MNPIASEPEVAQAAAICLRHSADHGGPEVLLIASRGTGEWWLPKGHIESGEASHDTAQREAREEAGVLGEVDRRSIGSFCYRKPLIDALYCVEVHLLRVLGQTGGVAAGEARRMRWVPLALAAREVGNPQLASLLDGVCAELSRSLQTA
ncbi:NUDIX hydrolase [Novosphingobium terrae]|uniref:NUDIX hydrolase n=1 Tax=Novosphingobium terrae TaxID=2726189 RepID=UPI001F147A10|nr:NUDIX hydrolase [Novosphingobium terrae]